MNEIEFQIRGLWKGSPGVGFSVTVTIEQAPEVSGNGVFNLRPSRRYRVTGKVKSPNVILKTDVDGTPAEFEGLFTDQNTISGHFKVGAFSGPLILKRSF